MSRLRPQKSVTILTASAVCALALLVGGSTAQAAPLLVQDELFAPQELPRAECTIELSTIAECFPDTLLASEVARQLGVTVTDVPTQVQLNSITEMSPADGVTSLAGLQHLSNLSKLTAESGTITDVSPLAGLTGLTELNFRYNEVTSVASLAGLPSLKTLKLSFNPVTDIASLSGIGTLRTLLAVGIGLDDATEVAGFTQLTELDIAVNNVSDLAPLAAWTGPVKLDVSENPLRDATMLAPGVSLYAFMAYADSPEIPFTRGQRQGSVVLTSGLDAVSSTFASRFLIDGKTYSYVWFRGDAKGTNLMQSTGPTVYASITTGTSVLTERGDIVTARMGGLDRRSEREVTSTGAILHTVTMTNPASAADSVTTRFYDSPETQLNGIGNAPMLSDGLGGFYIETDAMTAYLQPISGVDRVFGGQYNATAQVRDLVERDIQPTAQIFSSAGAAAGTPLGAVAESAIYYVTPAATLAPGQSFTYSYRETLLLPDENAQIQVDYVDDVTGDVITEATQAFTGEVGATLELSEAEIVVPSGYTLADSVTLPIPTVYGTPGFPTAVQIPVHAIAEPGTDPGTEPGNENNNTSPSVSDNGSLATTGGSLATSIIMGTLAVAGIALGLVLVMRRRRA